MSIVKLQPEIEQPIDFKFHEKNNSYMDGSSKWLLKEKIQVILE